MLDVEELDASLKIKALARLTETKHPFLSIIKDCVELDNFFAPSCKTNVEAIIYKAVALVSKDRDKLWSNLELNSNAKLISTIRKIPLRQIISPAGRGSINYFNVWHRGARLVGDLNGNDLTRLARFIDNRKLPKIQLAVDLRLDQPKLTDQIYVKNTFRTLSSCSSKEIRLSRSNNIPITLFKCDLDLTPSESINFFYQLNRLSSTRHKNMILRYLHGDIYTKERLFRFGMTDSPICPRCDSIETLNHKFLECDYASRIWAWVKHLTSSRVAIDPIRAALAIASKNQEDLTLHAEILLRIQYLKEGQDYLLRPQVLVEHALKDLVMREENKKVKERLKTLLRSD